MTVMFPSFGSDSEDSKAGMPTAPYMVTDVSRVASLRQNRTAANLEDPMCQWKRDELGLSTASGFDHRGRMSNQTRSLINAARTAVPRSQISSLKGNPRSDIVTVK